MTQFETMMLILTTLYVVATVFIFWITSFQFINYRKELRQKSILDIVRSNREILMIGIQNPLLLKVFGQSDNEEHELLNRYSQLWINHAHAIWYTRAIFGHIDDAEWKPLEKDMITMFNQPAIKKRWESCQNAYQEEFRIFINATM